MLTQNTRESALRREDFHRVLQAWLDDTLDSTAGEADSHAGPAWVWVRHGGAHYYLTAATTRDGVREYLRVVKSAGGDPQWSAGSSDSSVREPVKVGPDRRSIDGFEFYQHIPSR